MTSQPTIPVQQPLVSNNPIVNPLRDMTAGNVFQTQQTEVERARMLAKKEVEKEFQKQLQQWKEKEQIDKGKNVGQILDKKFGKTYEQPTQVALQSPVKSVIMRKFSEGEMIKPVYEEKEEIVKPEEKEEIVKPKEKLDRLVRRKDETEKEWAKRLRDDTEKTNKLYQERSRKAFLNLESIGKNNEEEKHEPPNRYTKDTRGRKPIEITDSEKKHLGRKQYRELINLETEYDDGSFEPTSKEYHRMNYLRGIVIKNMDKKY